MKKAIQNALHDRLPAVLAGQYRQTWHLMADIGWISDPNGLCQHNGLYHIFHQYTPAQDLGLHKSWGHYVTRDWKHFADLGTLMCPDSEIDKDACYSGSGFSHNGILHLFYTGNILHDGDFDYINEGRGHYTNTLQSADGIHFSDKKVLLRNEDYPDGLSCHVRDPKVSDIDGRLYMVIGARTRDSRGCALVYECSRDNLEDLTFRQVIRTPEGFGYMWECPVLFKLDQQVFLLCCPQGVAQDGYKYENVYQNGVFRLTPDADGSWQAADFQELDHGFDFYASQSFRDEQGREILIGWMGLPDAEYGNPETAEGLTHSLTMPRQLSVKNGRICQYPIQEILDLRTESQTVSLEPGRPVYPESRSFVLETADIQNRPFEMVIRQDVSLQYAHGVVTMEFLRNGEGRTSRHIDLQGRPLESLDVFSDSSSLEIFLNGGEEAFTTRIYSTGQPSLSCSIPLTGTLSVMHAIRIDWKPALGTESCEAAIQALQGPQTASVLKSGTAPESVNRRPAASRKQVPPASVQQASAGSGSAAHKLTV